MAAGGETMATDPAARLHSESDDLDWVPLPDVTSRPTVSVVITCRNNERTIRAAVQSVFDQGYPRLAQIILVGSPWADATWRALRGLDDRRLTICELTVPPGLRDVSFKRDSGIKLATSDLVALLDGNVALPPDWLTRAQLALSQSRAGFVGGGIRSTRDDLSGRFTGRPVAGARTWRRSRPYALTPVNFGIRGHKPPTAASLLFQRVLYGDCPIDTSTSHGGYEDYEWFWRVVRSGHDVRVCPELLGWRPRKHGMRALVTERVRSARGRAYFARTHGDCPLARRRQIRARTLPIGAVVAVVSLVVALAGYGVDAAGLLLACAVTLPGYAAIRSRRIGRARGAATGAADDPEPTLAPAARHRTAQPAQPAQPLAPSKPSQASQASFRPVRALLHPLTVICAVQAALSLSLVWSNTAFTDEADYLWLGRLVLASWLHGSSWPATYGHRVLSGSPIIYPPLGALADAVGGLAGARILSLAFMLGATVLLYLTASALFGRATAVAATALWALSEPVVRLAFATYDPLSVFLTAFSAWLVVQAASRRRHGELVAASAGALALANATTYSTVVIDPVVIAFVFCTWQARLGTRRAGNSAAWFAGTWATIFYLLLRQSQSWAGVTVTVLDRRLPDHQAATVILGQVWSYSGLIIVLSLIGVVIARHDDQGRTGLLAVLGCAVLIVPVTMLYFRTAWLPDKHMSYGIWFAVMAAGYGCARLIRWLPGIAAKPGAVALVSALALLYPVIASWQAASQTYRGWPNATSFVAAFRPIVARSSGLILAAGQMHVAEYYTPQGQQWARWNSQDITLNPSALRPGAWSAYYRSALGRGNYGIIALFYVTSFSSARLPGSMLVSPHSGRIYQELLGQVGVNSGEPGLPELTLALEQDPAYRLVAVGRYDSAHVPGIYAIWQKITV
jgi:glycosyltransferase involved in cell wall biosynthesis